MHRRANELQVAARGIHHVDVAVADVDASLALYRGPLGPLGLAEAFAYKRSGTSSLCAALDITCGKVISALHSRHRAIEFKQFLKTLDREVPAELDVDLVLDNSSTHKTPAIRDWLAAHPRFVWHFTADLELIA